MKVLRKVYFWCIGIKKNVKLHAIRKKISQRSTFVGTGQCFRVGATVSLSYGSTKEDVVLNDHCELFGHLSSSNHGKIILGSWAKVGLGTHIEAVNKIEIGNDTAIAFDVTITDNSGHPTNPQDRRYMRHTPHGSKERSSMYSANAPIIIGENVWIGSRSRICKGVTIGDNAIIAANSVVTHDVPANAIAAGNPARIVKEHIDQITTPIFPITE